MLKARQELARADNAVRINRVALDTLTGGALGLSYTVEGEFLGMPKDLQIDALMARMMQPIRRSSDCFNPFSNRIGKSNSSASHECPT